MKFTRQPVAKKKNPSFSESTSPFPIVSSTTQIFPLGNSRRMSSYAMTFQEQVQVIIPDISPLIEEKELLLEKEKELLIEKEKELLKEKEKELLIEKEKEKGEFEKCKLYVECVQDLIEEKKKELLDIVNDIQQQEETMETKMIQLVRQIIKEEFHKTQEGIDEQTQEGKEEGFDYDMYDSFDHEDKRKNHLEKMHYRSSHPLMNRIEKNYSLNSANLNSEGTLEIQSIYNSCIEHEYYEMKEFQKKENRWFPIGDGIEKNTVMSVTYDTKMKVVYVCGLFEENKRNQNIKNIASYNQTKKEWNCMNGGVNNLASVMVLDETSQILYVGGIFTKAGVDSIPVNHICSYDIYSGTWNALGDGLDSECNAIVLSHQTLFVGGTFTHSVGMYDITKKEWHILIGGLKGPCRTLCIDESRNRLYVGGLFPYIAYYDLTNETWGEVGGGICGFCNTFYLDSTNRFLFVGGSFTHVNTDIEANHIAVYDFIQKEWSNLHNGVNGICYTIIMDQQKIYIGGIFTQSMEEDIVLNRIAMYDLQTEKWYALSNAYHETNIEIGLDGACKTICVYDKSLFVGGSFQKAGTKCCRKLVRYAL